MKAPVGGGASERGEGGDQVGAQQPESESSRSQVGTTTLVFDAEQLKWPWRY